MDFTCFVGGELLLLVAITCVFVGTYDTVLGNATPFVVAMGLRRSIGIAPSRKAI